MTASVLKQDPNTEKVKKNAIYCDKTRHANSRGKPPFFKLLGRGGRKKTPFQAT